VDKDLNTQVIVQKQVEKSINDLFSNLAKDKFWLDKHLYDDAEYSFFSKQTKAKKGNESQITKGNREDKSKDDDGNKEFKKDNYDSALKSKSSSRDDKDTNVSRDFYNWTDESSYLSPNIPLLSPTPITVQRHTEHEEQPRSKREASKSFADNIQVMLNELNSGVKSAEERLHQLSDEELQGQQGVVKFVLGKAEDLNLEATRIQQIIQNATPHVSSPEPLSLSPEHLSSADAGQLSAELSGLVTRLVNLETAGIARRSRLETYVKQRRKRIEQVKKYQCVLIELESWLEEAEATLSSDIKLTSAAQFKDQIRAAQLLEEDLRLRVDQLLSLSREVDQLTASADVAGLATELADRLALLRATMTGTQAGLAQRLSQLEV